MRRLPALIPRYFRYLGSSSARNQDRSRPTLLYCHGSLSPQTQAKSTASRALWLSKSPKIVFTGLWFDGSSSKFPLRDSATVPAEAKAASSLQQCPKDSREY